MALFDIHCHLKERDALVQNSSTNDFSKIQLVSTALSLADIEWHLEKNIKYWFAGLHPQDYNLSSKELEEFFKALPYQRIIGIGEIGLDKRYSNLEKQAWLLEKQLEIARIQQLPTLYHLVGYEYEFIKILKKSKLENIKIIHGFNSSFEIYKELDKLDFYFSLSNRLLRNSKHRKTLESILAGRKFFLESDAPFNGDFQEVDKVAKSLEIDYNIEYQEICKIVSNNFDILTRKECGTISKK